MRKLYLILACVFIVGSLIAQPPTIQDCLGAIPICQEIYSSNVSLPGDGNYPNEINVNISCTSYEDHSVWYSFTVDESGDFGFVITPNNSTDDYDWALFNITNAECEDIYTDPDLLVSCNASGGTFFDPNACSGTTGATGGTAYDIQGAGCGTFPPDFEYGYSTFNDLIPVQAGNTYVLMVSNWTGSTFGYEIDFGLTDVGVLDLTPPELATTMFPEVCNDDMILINFSENVDCSTVSDLNFNLTGPDGMVYNLMVNADICDAGGAYDDNFELQINPALIDSGTYALEIISEGANLITDVCGNPLSSSSHTFLLDTPGLPEVELGEDFFICDGQAIMLEVAAGQGNYSWQDGSNSNTYEVTTSGMYSLTVSNDCGMASDAINISLLNGPPVIELGNDTVLCEGNTLTLSLSAEAAQYLWQDGTEEQNYTINTPGLYAVTATNACGETEDMITIDYQAPIDIGLPNDISACEGDTLLLDVLNSGATYLWEDGSSLALRQIMEAGIYSVTISNDCATESAVVEVNYQAIPTVELGNDTTICIGEEVVLDASFPGSDYIWEDGTTAAQRSLSQEGSYMVIVSNECGEAVDEINLNIEETILPINLGADQYLCSDQISLEVDVQEGANYRWQNGLNSNNLEANKPGIYVLEVYNECATALDSIELFACEYCDVYIPNAFSPNDDGRNDLFYPYTPCELAEYQLEIYNRWGTPVFRSNSSGKGWDGTIKEELAPIGLYVWTLKYEVEVNGVVQIREDMGDLMLVR